MQDQQGKHVEKKGNKGFWTNGGLGFQDLLFQDFWRGKRIVSTATRAKDKCHGFDP